MTGIPSKWRLIFLVALSSFALALAEGPKVPPRPEPSDPPAAGKTEPGGKAADEVKTPSLGKNERKALKREKQAEGMLERLKKRADGGPPRRGKPASTAPLNTAANPFQLAEDFDWRVKWEEKDNRGVHPNMDFGYSGGNHVGASYAPGEIGGSLSGTGISWFADDIARGAVLLDAETPLTASGACKFTATGATAGVGWFNGDSYAAPHTAPESFLGWRQNGATLCAALGTSGSAFVDGGAIPLVPDSEIQWTLSYLPTGGAHGCGELTLRIGGASSALSLTRDQREALSKRKFSRFGLVSAKDGRPQASTVWLDNLIYTKVSGLPVPPAAAAAHTRTAFFDTDPTGSTFVGVNNLSPHEPVTVIQDYGYQPTGGRSGGCIGGRFTQAIGTSYYGYDYGERMPHLTEKLRSEGWFQVPSYEGRAVRIGWTSKQAKSWHEPSTLCFKISSVGVKGQGLRLVVGPECTLKNYEGHGGAGWGGFAFLSAGPQWHHYVLEFDPAAAFGYGAVTMEVDGQSKTFLFDEGKTKIGADLDLFGMWNSKIPVEDKVMTVYLDDVTNTVNGRRDPSSNDFNSPPAGWVGCNNSITVKDYVVRPYHQFGWAKSLLYLGGLNGYSPMYTIAETDRHCMGGIIYLASYENLNVPRAAYGADLHGLLNTKDHHMYATGRFKLDWANVDAAELFGWYNSATACEETTGGKGHMFPNKFLGVAIHGGSTGYAMIPSYHSPALSEEQMLELKDPAARVYQDGQWREFYMEYDPDGAGGKGQFKLQIGSDGTPVTYDLKEGAKAAEFAFDRFGLLTMRKGGGKPHAVYFDKITYTVAE